MKEGSKNTKRIVLGVAGLAVLAVLLVLVYTIFREKPVQGSKEIAIEVINMAGEAVNYELKTDAEYLRQAMEETEGLTFSGKDSEYGMMVEIVNGDKADYEKDGAYWSFYVNGEYCNYGIDTQPVEDGDQFRIEYTKGSE